jgi:hypothetical protein
MSNPDEKDLSPFRGLRELLRLGLPVLPADEANKEIISLNIKILELQAEIDRERLIQMYDEVIHER